MYEYAPPPNLSNWGAVIKRNFNYPVHTNNFEHWQLFQILKSSAYTFLFYKPVKAPKHDKWSFHSED